MLKVNLAAGICPAGLLFFVSFLLFCPMAQAGGSSGSATSVDLPIRVDVLQCGSCETMEEMSEVYPKCAVFLGLCARRPKEDNKLMTFFGPEDLNEGRMALLFKHEGTARQPK